MCTSLAAREGPLGYFKAIYEAYRLALRDRCGLPRRPGRQDLGHARWLTTELHYKVYRLGELSTYAKLDLPVWYARRGCSGNARNSRHWMLFDEVRYFAYGIVTAERSHVHCPVLSTG